jgi:hypothetical protein
MGEEQPEAKNWLGENIENSVGNDLGIEANDTGTIGNTPDARSCQWCNNEGHNDVHWVDGPEDKGEGANGTIESLSLVVLASHRTTAVVGKLVNDNKVGNASEGIPAPFLGITAAESCEQTSEDHDQIRNDGNQNVGTAETSQEAEIEEQEWGGDTPINVTGIVHLTEDVMDDVWDMLILLDNLDLVISDTITSGHCKV